MTKASLFLLLALCGLARALPAHEKAFQALVAQHEALMSDSIADASNSEQDEEPVDELLLADYNDARPYSNRSADFDQDEAMLEAENMMMYLLNDAMKNSTRGQMASHNPSSDQKLLSAVSWGWNGYWHYFSFDTGNIGFSWSTGKCGGNTKLSVQGRISGIVAVKATPSEIRLYLHGGQNYFKAGVKVCGSGKGTKTIWNLGSSIDVTSGGTNRKIFDWGNGKLNINGWIGFSGGWRKFGVMWKRNIQGVFGWGVDPINQLSMSVPGRPF